MREAGLLEDGEKVSSLFDDDEQICALAGEAYMKEIKTEKVESIEKQLSNIAKAINEEWKKRNTQSPFEIAVSELLGKEVFVKKKSKEKEASTEGVGSDQLTDEETSSASDAVTNDLRNENVDAQAEGTDVDDKEEENSDENITTRELMTKLQDLIGLLPQYQRDRFETTEIFPGLLCWLRFFNDLKDSMPQNEIYSFWF